MAMALVVAIVGNPFRPAGAVESAQEGPASAPQVGDGGTSPETSAAGEIAVVDDGTPSATAQVTSTPRPRPVAGPTPLVRPRVPPRAAGAVTTNPTPRPTVAPGSTKAPTQGPPTPSSPPSPTPTPTPTSLPFPPLPTPTPDPTAAPTPGPTPTPAPTPDPTTAPTPECSVVPNLVGLTVANARAGWADAGFTGSFTPGAGLNNKIVESQSQAVGACLPATTLVTVTYS